MQKVVAMMLVAAFLGGCSQLRHLTMTKDELNFFGEIRMNKCLDPTVVCIQP